MTILEQMIEQSQEASRQMARAVEVMHLAQDEIVALRKALLALKNRGTDENPCWCSFNHAGEWHAPQCENARKVLGL